jgi:hypothetical protein
MAEVYNVPSELKIPNLDFRNIKQYNEDCDKFKTDLKNLLIEKFKRTGENVGEIISFPVADGHAEYMVAGMKPVELIHIPLWDAWEFQYANRLTAKDVQEKINQRKALEKMFADNKAKQEKKKK